jgi:hypothetical protein
MESADPSPGKGSITLLYTINSFPFSTQKMGRRNSRKEPKSRKAERLEKDQKAKRFTAESAEDAEKK